MCIPFETVPPPNEKSQKMVAILKYICIAQVVLAILELFTNPFQGLYELFAVFILWQAYSTISYCSLIIYIFFDIMNLIQDILFFGNLWQNRQSVSGIMFPFIVMVLATLFYLIAIYYAFLAYREFKAITLSGEAMSSGGGITQPFASSCKQIIRCFN